MTPEQESAIQDMESFKEQIKERGLACQHNLWNMTGMILGTFLAALSIIATVEPDSNKMILYGSIAIAILGMVCIWRCFHQQKNYYESLVGLASHSIETHGKDYSKIQTQEPITFLKGQDCAENLATICLFISALGLVLTIVI